MAVHMRLPAALILAVAFPAVLLVFSLGGRGDCHRYAPPRVLNIRAFSSSFFFMAQAPKNSSTISASSGDSKLL